MEQRRTEPQPEPLEISEIKSFATTVNNFQSSAFFANLSILDFYAGSGYASGETLDSFRFHKDL